MFVYANTDNGEDTITGFIFGAGGDKLDLKDLLLLVVTKRHFC
ncbi:MAG: type I secretion C-terminal target domain-containing protein [Candidatus Thiodubiliella endoseptemdiera]|uniref:Type I secretion C-terminal target domain-containing protein n=1 Tax=Candidatus Thiodubiliella endoseptemdiera TaxID=2738886 RepID=A0A853F3I3_9GAMM|nr:type I secretion C-terminal target domain-containing protein [Candidatus Thiodubiliella endoseptemdiera]